MKRRLRLIFGGLTAGLLIPTGIGFIRGYSETGMGVQITLVGIFFLFYVLSEEE